MRPVLEMIARVGPSDASVLITGENGTGKGLVAQAQHAVSLRAGQSFIAGIGLVLCRQIAENHGGTLTLANREVVGGCVATLRLPT